MKEEYVKKFLDVFKIIDIYPSSLKIYLKNSIKVKTLFGGIISLIIILFFAIILVFLIVDLGIKINQYYSTSSLIYPSPPRINVTNSLSLSELNKIPFFFFSFFMYDNMRNPIDIEEFSKYFYFELNLNKYERINGTIIQSVLQQYKLINCTEKYSYEFQKLEIFNNSAVVNFNGLFFCINAESLQIEGDFINTLYQFFSLKIKSCQISSKKDKCETKISVINKFILELNIEFFYSSFQIESNYINRIPIEYSWRKLKLKLSSKIYQKYDFFLSLSEIFSEEDLFLKSLGMLKKDISFVEKFRIYHATLGNTYLAIFLRSSFKYLIIHRSYKTFLNLVSQIGGIWKFLFIISILIVKKVNLTAMVNKLANSIFAVVNLKAEEMIIKTENLDHYIRQGSDKSPNDILTSNNKSLYEADIYIDVFKYERYKGLAFDLNDVIKNQYLRCFTKKNSGNNFNEILEKRIFQKLDILKFLIFIKQFKIIKNFLFTRKKHLLPINQKNGIHIKNFIHLINSIKMLKLENDGFTVKNDDKRVKKETKFIKAIRYFKIKPILDKRIDFNIFKKFNWDKNIILKIFGKSIE